LHDSIAGRKKRRLFSLAMQYFLESMHVVTETKPGLLSIYRNDCALAKLFQALLWPPE
jgi:hypothetical protein